MLNVSVRPDMGNANDRCQCPMASEGPNSCPRPDIASISHWSLVNRFLIVPRQDEQQPHAVQIALSATLNAGKPAS